MHPRYAVLFTLLVLTISSLGAAVPAAEGPEDGAGGTTWYGPLLYLKAGTFDPLTEPAPGPSGLMADPTHPYYVIQYDGPIQKAWREAAAEAGVELLDYIPDFGYFARIPRDRLIDARSLDHLRYIGPAHLAYRIHPDLWQGELKSRELTIATWGADAANSLAMSLMMAGAKVISQEDDRIVAWVNPVVVVALARDKDAAVSWVEPHFAPELHLDKDARTSNARQQNDGAYQMNDASAWSYNSATGNFEGWTGENVTVAVLDTGLDDSHPAFTGRIVKYYDYGRDGVRDISGHGTHCAGIVLGNGSWRPSNRNRAINPCSSSSLRATMEAGPTPSPRRPPPRT
jgi:subtilisin family serine protease